MRQLFACEARGAGCYRVTVFWSRELKSGTDSPFLSRIPMRALKSILACFLVFVSCVLPASACAIPPESASLSLDEMFKGSDAVYVGELVDLRFGKNERTYTLHVTETLKGTPRANVSVPLPWWAGASQKEKREAFEHGKKRFVDHSDPLFWMTDERSFGGVFPDCSVDFAPFQGRFVVFLPLQSVRSIEPITSAQDNWYRTVKAVSQGQPPYLKLTPLAFLQRFESVYTAKCFPKKPKGQTWVFEHIRGRSFDNQRLNNSIPGEFRDPPVACFAHLQPTLELLLTPRSDDWAQSTLSLEIVGERVQFQHRYQDIELTETTANFPELKLKLGQ